MDTPQHQVPNVFLMGSAIAAMENKLAVLEVRNPAQIQVLSLSWHLITDRPRQGQKSGEESKAASQEDREERRETEMRSRDRTQRD